MAPSKPRKSPHPFMDAAPSQATMAFRIRRFDHAEVVAVIESADPFRAVTEAWSRFGGVDDQPSDFWWEWIRDLECA